jgi:TRAP-type C4-dicarboxylate transport system substrate-binding protein
MPLAIGVGNAKWASLDPAIRQVLTEEGQALWKKSLDDAVDPKIRGSEVQATLAATDIKLLQPFPDADRTAIVEAIRTAWAELATKAGRRAPEWRERVLKALK